MSIINEALKKTQKSRKQDQDKRAHIKEKIATESPIFSVKQKYLIMDKLDYLFNWKMGSYVVGTALLAILAFTSYQHVKNGNMPIVQTAMKETKEKMAFTGVFVSDNSKIAVINKQSYHMGDTVNGMKILAIHQDSVDLQRDDKVIQIRAGATYML